MHKDYIDMHKQQTWSLLHLTSYILQDFKSSSEQHLIKK